MDRRSEVHDPGCMVERYAYVDVRFFNRGSNGSDPSAKRLQYLDPYKDPFGFDQQLPKSPPMAVKGDDYEHLQLNRKPSDRSIRDPINYWIKTRDRYPRLLRMALDFLTIQAMSAKCEKVFSAAGKMMVAERNKLKVEAIAMCQVLRL
jgi:hypothetical protein